MRLIFIKKQKNIAFFPVNKNIFFEDEISIKFLIANFNNKFIKQVN